LVDRVLYYGHNYLSKIGMEEVDRSDREVLRKLGVEFVTLDPEPYMLEWMHVLGFKERAMELIKRFNDVLGRLNVCCAVTTLGGHVLFWNRTLRDFGLEPAVEFKDFTSFVHDLISERGGVEFSEVRKRIYLHYPCCLGRKMGTDAYAKKIKSLLSSIPGVEILETLHPEVQEGIAAPWQWSPCALTGIKTIIPKLHAEALTNEVKDDLDSHKPEAIVSPCARSVWSFRDAFAAKGISGIEVLHTSSLILQALR